MIGYFNQRNSFQLPAVLVLAILLKMSFVTTAPTINSYYDAGGWLTTYLNRNFAGKVWDGLPALIGQLFLLGSALYANYVISNRRMFAQRHSLVAVSMLLFTALFPATNLYLPTLLLLPLFIGIFSQITLLYNTTQVKSSIINAGILAGIGYLLYHPFIFFLPACFIGLAYMRPFRISEWILLLLGMFTPVYFLLAAEFLTNQWHPDQHLPHLVFNGIAWKLGIYWWIAFGTTVVWTIVAIMEWQRQSMRMVIQGRKNWYALLMMGLFALPALVLPASNNTGMLVLLSFPLGSLLANAFSSETKARAKTIFFWGILGAILVVSLAYKAGLMH